MSKKPFGLDWNWEQHDDLADGRSLGSRCVSICRAGSQFELTRCVLWSRSVLRNHEVQVWLGSIWITHNSRGVQVFDSGFSGVHARVLAGARDGHGLGLFGLGCGGSGSGG